MADVFVLDTSVLLADPLLFLSYDLLPEYRVIILKPVLEELDLLKTREGETGYSAREASRQLEQLIHTKKRLSATEWLVLPNCVLQIDEDIDWQVPSEMRGTYDDRIIASALLYTEASEAEHKVWLTTLDRNMRIRAEAKGISCLNPAGWFKVGPNTWAIPLATYGLAWNPEGRGFVIPVDLAACGEGNLHVWPYWGYQSGLFSVLHIRLFEPDYAGENDKASPVLMVSAENRIRYEFTMRSQNIPYRLLVARPNAVGVVYHKTWKVEVRIDRCEILTKPVQISKWEKQRALRDIAFSAGYLGDKNLIRSLATGMIVGQAWNTLTAESKAPPAFRKLGLHIKVSRAEPEELEAIEQAASEGHKFCSPVSPRKPDKTLWVVLGIVLAVVILPVLLCATCFGFQFLLALLTQLLGQS